MREIVHLQAGQCGNQIGAKVWCTPLHLEYIHFLSKKPRTLTVLHGFSVLGSDFWWAWHRPNWHIPRRFWSSVGKNQCVLQRSYRYFNSQSNGLNVPLRAKVPGTRKGTKNSVAPELPFPFPFESLPRRLSPRKLNLQSIFTLLIKAFNGTLCSACNTKGYCFYVH